MPSSVSNHSVTPISAVIVPQEGCERLNLSYGDAVVSIATAHFKEPSNWTEKVAHFLKQFTWTVVTVETEPGVSQKVWINVNSAVKKLAVLNLHKEDVLDALKSQAFMPKIGTTIRKRADENKPLKTFYQEVMGCDEAVSAKVIQLLKNKNLGESSIRSLIEYIRDQRDEIRKKMDKTQSCIYVDTKGKKLGGKAPSRSLLFTPSGDVYINLSKNRLGDKLVGSGAYKTVKESVNLCTGEGLVKVSQKVDKESPLEDVENEVKISRILGEHSNIAKVRLDTVLFSHSEKSNTDKGRWLMDFYNGGELKQAIKTDSLSRQEKNIIARGMLAGTVYMHSKGVLHRDLKPANVLLEKDENGRVCNARLADFGLSCELTDQKQMQYIVGTPVYLSPDFFSRRKDMGKINSNSSDCWALGCILFEMYKGAPLPWVGTELKSLKVLENEMKNYQRSSYPVIQKLKDSEDPVDQAIYGLLNASSKTRMTAEQALELLSKAT